MNCASLRSKRTSSPGKTMANLEELRNTLSFLVGVVDEVGELRGRVRLQKLGYLLQQSGFAPLARTEFSYHHYGPYSDQLAGTLEKAVVSDLIREVEQRSDGGHRHYIYQPNSEHPDRAYLELTPSELTQLRRITELTRWTKWRTLELAATVVYLERNMDLSRDAALQRALALKPNCSDFRAQAEDLLAKLGLDGTSSASAETVYNPASS